MFRGQGYVTGFVGKWHLGLGVAGRPCLERRSWSPVPEEIGFDETFYFSATGDRVPTVFVRNHRVVNLDPRDPITINYRHRIANEPTGITDPDLATVLRNLPGHGHADAITNGVTRIGFMTGGRVGMSKDRADFRRPHRPGGGLYRATPPEAVLSLFRHPRHPRAAQFRPHVSAAKAAPVSTAISSRGSTTPWAASPPRSTACTWPATQYSFSARTTAAAVGWATTTASGPTSTATK